MEPEYLCWLETFHPEAVPADRYSLVAAPSGSTPFRASISDSVVEHFSSVSSLKAVNISGSSTCTASEESSSSRS